MFLVGLEGTDQELLERIQGALQAPFWLLALGRKGFPPGEPVWLPDGQTDAPLRTALVTHPPLTSGQPDRSLRLMLEHDSHGAVRIDQPIAPFAQRRFGPRYIVSEAIHVPVPVNA